MAKPTVETGAKNTDRKVDIKKVVLGTIAALGVVAVSAASAAGIKWVADFDHANNVARNQDIQRAIEGAQLDTAHRIYAGEPVAFEAGRLVCAGFSIENPLVRNIGGFEYYGEVNLDNTSPNGVTVTFINDYKNKCTLEPESADAFGFGTTYNAILENPDGQNGGPLFGKDADSPYAHQAKGAGNDGTFLGQGGQPVPIGFEYDPKK